MKKNLTRDKHSRRGFFKQSATVSAGLGTLSLVTSLSTPKIAAKQSEYQLKLVSWYEPDFLNQFTMTQRLADRVALLSDGRLAIDVIDPNNAGFPREEIFQKVSDGTIDMGRTLSYYWNEPLQRPLDFFFVIPFGLTQKEFTTWLYYLDGQALWDEVYSNYGVKPFLCGSLDAQSFGWFKQEITSPDDLRGLKYRTTGPMLDIMQRVGANPVNLGGDEILAALQDGRIDGAELVGPAADIQFGFEEVAPYQYWPGFHQPMGAIELIVNQSRYEQLPDDLKAILKAACQAEHDLTMAQMHLMNAQALQQLDRSGKMQLRRLPPDVLEVVGEASMEWIDDLATNSDSLTQRIAKSYLEARLLLKPWSEISEGWFLAGRETI
ncbi:conserved hypothetical protein [Hyella patelloides LEGE 07179]|uniref:Uncharacterized protein n=1 Tax=Hyella patelloides LEGE 07179 TaxID=945734 RepID=A0A563VZP9_9CYAN|nr:TRAP transporter substrate-binding protein [Hyella patelloides]VEP16942.1 conserved hypothetical protein [Hyella patelloides LEGE 07179]